MREDVYQAIVELRAAGRSGCAATVVSVTGSAPQRVGAKMLVRSDGSIVGTVGGGRLEKQVIEDALGFTANGDGPEVRRYELTAALGMCCGGTMEVFLEPIRAPERLIVFGAGHVGRAIAEIAAAAHFEKNQLIWSWSTADPRPSSAPARPAADPGPS